MELKLSVQINSLDQSNAHMYLDLVLYSERFLPNLTMIRDMISLSKDLHNVHMYIHVSPYA